MSNQNLKLEGFADNEIALKDATVVIPTGGEDIVIRAKRLLIVPSETDDEAALPLEEKVRLAYGESDLGTRVMVYGGEIIEF